MEEKANFFDNEMLVRKLSYILNGTNRIKIYLALIKGVKTARELESDLNVVLTSVCRTLKGLEKRKVIKCINSFESRGKLYKLEEDVLDLKLIIKDKAKKKDIKIPIFK
ncbi:MAG: hypothetical protein ACFFAU_19135 [Candidatus Hodarchaeota archaeon]